MGPPKAPCARDRGNEFPDSTLVAIAHRNLVNTNGWDVLQPGFIINQEVKLIINQVV